MCGLAGIIDLNYQAVPDLERRLQVMNSLQKHRGPDGAGLWRHEKEFVGLAHRRLSIIDPSPDGVQPMTDRFGNWIVYNGAIYNYPELRRELGEENFVSRSDTETILWAYRKWGRSCLERLRGMFAFALWDDEEQTLFCARDRFGIKPFHYSIVDGIFYFASETKALLPAQKEIATDAEAFKDYLVFQFCLPGKTLFRNISELPPAHHLAIKHGRLSLSRYWESDFQPDHSRKEDYFQERLRAALKESVALHLRGDVPVGAYLSGGLDSSLIATLAARCSEDTQVFTGKFSAHGPAYDESGYARLAAAEAGLTHHECDITVDDFIQNIGQVIYHLDYPVGGPGSLPQYLVSARAAGYRKVVLGGQGGDEIFGGYVRYLIAYFEQCIKGAIEDTLHNGDFLVTYESIIPNLKCLNLYKPLIKEFWAEGLFEPMDRRYYQLINRAKGLEEAVEPPGPDGYSPWAAFERIFNSPKGRVTSYFDKMTNFDFQTMLPALLQIEDRMSMAHGLEARVPLLDHHLVELAATIPANIKFKNGRMKHIFREAARPFLPSAIVDRQDKMGFPTPLVDWLRGEAREFVRDALASARAFNRGLVDNKEALRQLDKEPDFGRNIWGLLCLELWQSQFHDRAAYYRRLFERPDFEPMVRDAS